MTLTVIRFPADDPNDDVRLDGVLSTALEGADFHVPADPSGLSGPFAPGSRLLFALSVGSCGVNAAYTRFLRRLRTEKDLLEGCVSELLVDGAGEFYTKAAATELAFALNGAGSALIGRPLVEGTGSLANFRVLARSLGTDESGAYRAAAKDLVSRLLAHTFPPRETPALLALHASNYRTSNTMQLWGEVKQRLDGVCAIEEIGLRNGTINDCAGCPYTACLHFGEQGRCFYGGLIQEEVWPAVLRADAIVLLCPNYNDAISANLTAFINRLTGLFRQKRFYDKAVFAIVVSGYSGSDIVARQLIGAMNMNKSFFLPPRFCLIETANDPGEALALPGIGGRIDAFAKSIETVLKKDYNKKDAGNEPACPVKGGI